MKNLFILIVFFVSWNCFAETTNYVSTFNMDLKVKNKAKFTDFKIIKIEDSQKAKDTIDFATKNFNDQLLMVFMMTLNGRDYSKENCYVIFSPFSKSLSFSDPFYLENQNKLFFKLNSDHPKSYFCIPTAIYWVDKDKDLFQKIALLTNKEIILEEKK